MKLTYYVKGGLIGIALYLLSVVLTLLVTIFHDTAFITSLEPIAPLFIPVFFIVFHPAMYLNNNYEALWFIVPFNLLFYFLVGMFIARLIRTLKTYRSKS